MMMADAAVDPAAVTQGKKQDEKDTSTSEETPDQSTKPMNGVNEDKDIEGKGKEENGVVEDESEKKTISHQAYKTLMEERDQLSLTLQQLKEQVRVYIHYDIQFFCLVGRFISRNC